MRVSIRITFEKDPELVALYYQLGSKAFSNFIKDALRWVIRPGYIGTTIVPIILTLSEEHRTEKIRVSICLKSMKDQDIVHLLNGIKPRMMALFVRQTAKLYLGTKGLGTYFGEEMTAKLIAAQTPVTVQVYQMGVTETPSMPIKRKVSRKPKKKEMVSTTPPIPSHQEKPVSEIPSSPVMKPNYVLQSEPEEYTQKETSHNQNMSMEDEALALLNSLLG